MQADQQEDALLAERLSSHSLAGPSHAKDQASLASCSSSVGVKAVVAELAVDSPDPMGMGIIDARTCTLVGFQGFLPHNMHGAYGVEAGRRSIDSQQMSHNQQNAHACHDVHWAHTPHQTVC